MVTKRSSDRTRRLENLARFYNITVSTFFRYDDEDEDEDDAEEEPESESSSELSELSSDLSSEPESSESSESEPLPV